MIPARSCTARAGFFLCAMLLSGCANLSYYGQLAKGQYDLLSRREPIAGIVGDPARDAKLRERLQKVLDARAYASARLGLPDNGSYTEYADLERAYAVWNVFATPELSLDPVQHCFMLAGCVSYRGYFKKELAEAEAVTLRDTGHDTYVSGVPAYSTLGWFDDPVLNTMMGWTDEALLGTVFHELAHQQLYLKGDSTFNESFASFVEREGLRQYLASQGGGEAQTVAKQRQREFTKLVLAARDRLTLVYRSGVSADEMRARKQQEFTRLKDDYRALRDGAWGGYAGYDRWFEGEINNAKLLPFGLYDQWVPAFSALFEKSGREWRVFYAAAKELSKQPDSQRWHSLQELARAAPSE